MGLSVSDSNWCIRHVWLSGASLWLLRFGFSHSDLQLFELFVFEPQFILHLWVTATWFSHSCCHFICHRALQPGLCLCMSESFHWFYTHILNSCCRSCLSSSWTVAVFSKISILYFKVFSSPVILFLISVLRSNCSFLFKTSFSHFLKSFESNILFAKLLSYHR